MKRYAKSALATAVLTVISFVLPLSASAQQGELPQGEGIECGDSYVELECHGDTASVQLQAQAFQFEGSSLTWSSTCIGGTFSDTGISNPFFTLNSELSPGIPQDCQVILFLDFGYGYGQTCAAPVSVSSCRRDCSGVIDGSATVDRCGVCNGDGTSCLDCTTVDTLPALLSLDGSVLGQRDLVFSATKLLLDLAPTKANRTLAEKSDTLAQNLYEQTWTQIYSLPPVVLSCGNTSFCTSASTAEYVSTFRSNASKLTELLTQTVRTIRKLGIKPGAGKRLLAKSSELSRVSEAAIRALPAAQSQCS